MVLLCSRCHKVRQNGKCHILESDRLSVEQLQKIHAVRLCERCDLLCVEFLIVCMGNTVFQFFFRVIGQELFHNCVCRLLICHSGKLVHRHVQRRDALRNVETAVICKSF